MALCLGIFSVVGNISKLGSHVHTSCNMIFIVFLLKFPLISMSLLPKSRLTYLVCLGFWACYNTLSAWLNYCLFTSDWI